METIIIVKIKNVLGQSLSLGITLNVVYKNKKHFYYINMFFIKYFSICVYY